MYLIHDLGPMRIKSSSSSSSHCLEQPSYTLYFMTVFLQRPLSSCGPSPGLLFLLSSAKPLVCLQQPLLMWTPALSILLLLPTPFPAARLEAAFFNKIVRLIQNSPGYLLREKARSGELEVGIPAAIQEAIRLG